MTTNEIIGRLRDGGLEASHTNRNAQVYVTYSAGTRENPGWFGFRIICNTEATERRAKQILSRWYDIEVSGNVWRLRANRRQPVMVIKKGGAPSSNDYMYLEAAQANSTVSMVSTLETAPNLEYSTDGVTWQEWQHTTAEGTHTFDTITLGDIGDRVYLRGNNPDGLGYHVGKTSYSSNFVLTGVINGGGNIMSILDTTMALTEVPQFGLMSLFAIFDEGIDPALLTTPSMETITAIGERGCENMYYGCSSITSAADMPALITIGDYGCSSMYDSCTSLTSAADMPILTTISDGGCESIYYDCTFDMSDDGTTLNFAFPTPPVTAGIRTFATAYDIAEWMGNTNGF